MAQIKSIYPFFLFPSISADQVISFTGAAPAGTSTINISPPSATAAMPTAQNSTATSPLKPEFLPANLDDLTVSVIISTSRKHI